MLQRAQLVLLIFVLTAIFIASSWPLFNKSMFFTHDFVHGTRIAEMARAITDGHFPVRWSQNFGYGYGMPLFEFYAPLPFYFGSLFYLAGVSLVGSVKAMFYTATFVTLLASYLLGKELYGKWGGIVVAAAITLAPYRALNLFIRGAISEVWGIMGAVLILLSIVLVIRRGSKFVPLLTVSLATLLLSHNLVSIIFLPFAVFFTLVFLVGELITKNRNQSLHSFLIPKIAALILSALLGLCVSAFYWLPAFVEKNYTKLEETIVGNYFDYHLHFLYLRQFFRPGWGFGGSEWGPNDPLSFFLGYGQWLGIFISVLVLGYAGYGFLSCKKIDVSVKKNMLLTICFGVLSLVALFFTMEKTITIWEGIELLKFIQFPWRYLSAAIIFIGLFTGAAVVYLPLKFRPVWAGVITLLIIGVNWSYFKPEHYITDTQSLYYTEPIRIQSHMSNVLPDYIPSSLRVTKPMIIPSSSFTCLDSSNCPKGELLVGKVQYKKYLFDANKNARIIFPLAYYPGWFTLVNGEKQEPQVSPTGSYLLELKPGVSTVEFIFGSTPIRKTADTISIVAVILTLLITIGKIWLYSRKEI